MPGIFKPKEIRIHNVNSSVKFMVKSIEQNDIEYKRQNIERSFMYLYTQHW